MIQLLQTIILGLLIGGVYALMASGLTLVFGIMGIVNVAQGALLVLVAMVTWKAWQLSGFDPILLSVATTPAMFGLGWLLYKLVIVRVRGASPAMSLLLMFGVALTVEGLLNITAGNYFRSATPVYFNQSFHIGPLVLPKAQVYGCLAAVLVLGLLYLVLNQTWTGRAIRACAQNPSGAALVGIGSGSVAALSFAIGTATAGTGGSILSVLYPFFPASHYEWIARLLGIIVLGGMGSLRGAAVGAVVLGLAETITATYGSLRWSTLVFYAVILLVLLVRPHGLFGTKLREDAVVT
ncbi:MAG TPA: branched-chain amino acid ABC transporter permease [Actinophytocola sp.]|uniref:branched-chain amino acid ABC transporter permease n=1 Tax=Actinophytocola sp. TaxID=1872138 RepID=UPI002DDD3E5D|nr:branched-chain amino acid ABC transporter permease [Actinophytocola sp.]HEV2783713.1 branched-chain amino acid ABC transporter permease [Actinophytocola sp.]